MRRILIALGLAVLVAVMAVPAMANPHQPRLDGAGTDIILPEV